MDLWEELWTYDVIVDDAKLARTALTKKQVQHVLASMLFTFHER